jgi:outer membrane protein TolC
MNKIFYVLSILSLIVISFNTIQGQTSELDDSSLSSSEFKFPTLRVVMDSVLKRSAMVNFRNYNIESKEATLATERIHWSRNIGVQADTRYGNLSNFATSEDGLNNTAALTTARQFNYSVGLFVRFPLFDAINRKNQIKLAESEVEAAKSMADFEKEQIRQTVIIRYQDLIFKHKLLQIKSRNLGDGRVNRQMVEKEFRNGIVPLSEYVRITNLTADMEAAYEKAMSEFIIAKQLLEDMAGFVFSLIDLN